MSALNYNNELIFRRRILLVINMSFPDSSSNPIISQIQLLVTSRNSYFHLEKSAKSSKSEPLVSTDWLVDKEEAFYLYSLGPNSASLGQLGKDFNLVTQSSNE